MFLYECVRCMYSIQSLTDVVSVIFSNFFAQITLKLKHAIFMLNFIFVILSEFSLDS